MPSSLVLGRRALREKNPEKYAELIMEMLTKQQQILEDASNLLLSKLKITMEMMEKSLSHWTTKGKEEQIMQINLLMKEKLK